MITDLYHAYNIETAPQGHKHFRKGWENIPCPHCMGSGYSLGFNTAGGYYYCYKCGGHKIEPTLVKLLRVSYEQAGEIVRLYRLRTRSFNDGAVNNGSRVKIGTKPFRYPSETGPIGPAHKNYLKKRNFNPADIEALWGIEGTSPTSHLDKIPYSYRILIPILWKDKVSTFQCRDFTGKQEQKYMACPEQRELVHHKHILYGHPTLWEKKRAIIVEGALDVWRIGVNACATLGTGYTPEQLRLMAKTFKEVVIMFDPEPLAQATARKLGQELSFRGVKVQVFNELETDPGDLSDAEAKRIVKQLNF